MYSNVLQYRTLYDDAQAARIYRDEIDALRTKVTNHLAAN